MVGINNLCAGLEAGIKGGIHFIRQLQQEHLGDDEPWGMLLIDAKNAFNEGSRKMMAWVARHEWPLGCRMLLSFYRHHSSLVIRGECP